MKLNKDTMTEAQADLFSGIGPAVGANGFYLAGGTAIALALGHRRSIDLDWFSTKPIGDPMLLAAELRRLEPDLQVLSVAPGTLHASAHQVRLTFLEYKYATLLPPHKTVEGCLLARLEDLAAMKLSAIAQRGLRKDFCDVFALCKSTFTLPQMLECYRRRYAIDEITHLLYGLCYFDDAEKAPMPDMIWEHDWPEMRKFIENAVANFLRR